MKFDKKHLDNTRHAQAELDLLKKLASVIYF